MRAAWVVVGAVMLAGAGAGGAARERGNAAGEPTLVFLAEALGDEEVVLWDGTRGRVLGMDAQGVTVGVADGGPSEAMMVGWGSVRALGAAAAAGGAAWAGVMEALWRAERALARGDGPRCWDVLEEAAREYAGNPGATALQVFGLRRAAALRMGDAQRAGRAWVLERMAEGGGLPRVEASGVPLEFAALILEAVGPNVASTGGAAWASGEAFGGEGVVLMAAAGRAADGQASEEDLVLLRDAAARWGVTEGPGAVARAGLACAAARSEDGAVRRGGVVDLVGLFVELREGWERWPERALVARAALARAAAESERGGDAETAERLRERARLEYGSWAEAAVDGADGTVGGADGQAGERGR